MNDALPMPPRCFIELCIVKGLSPHKYGEVYDHPSGTFIRWEDFARYHAAVVGLIANDRRYRYLREPDNAMVYVKQPEAWGYKDSPSGHVSWARPELMDAAIDAVLAGRAPEVDFQGGDA